jgi:alpha-tubulin suppressor-like RCC1 family protein
MSVAIYMADMSPLAGDRRICTEDRCWASTVITGPYRKRGQLFDMNHKPSQREEISQYCATPLSNHGRRWSLLTALVVAVAVTTLCFVPEIARGGMLGEPVGWGTYDEFSMPVTATNVVPSNVTNLTAIAGGSVPDFSLGLTTGGTVIGWGDNTYGQTNVPAGATNVVSIAAGAGFGMALSSNGTVIAWGYNSDGQTNVPASVTNAVGIGAGYYHALAILPNGNVLAWGNNSNGQTNVPAGVTNAVAVAGGNTHSLALLSHGSVIAWGDNSQGQTNVPASVTNAVAIAAGYLHSVALKADGTVIAWGYNGYGETNVPASVTNAIAIGASYITSFAVLANGGIVVWGYTGGGQGSVPASVTNAVAIAGGEGYALALVGTNITTSAPSGPPTVSCPNTTRMSCTETNGTSVDVTVSVTDTNGNAVQVVWYVNGTASQTNSVLGGGATSTNVTLAADFADPGPYTIFVSASDGITSAVSCVTEVDVDTAGTVFGWGNTSFGLTNAPANLTNAVAVSQGFEQALALTSEGTVVGWGPDQFGEINVPSGATNVVAVAAGRIFSLALKWDGTVVGWGDDGYGEINVPTSVSNAVAIAGGGIHGLALISNGTVIGWGDNTYGQTNVPASVTNAVAVSAGFYYSLALKADGTVVGWGYDIDGETNVPASVTNAVAISAGYYHALALKSDGTIIAWGDNTYGETTVPAGATNALSIAAGYYFSLALMPDGTVMAWGTDSTGETETHGLADAVSIAAGQWGSEAIDGLQINLVDGATTNVECHSIWSDPGWTATGLCGVNLTSSVTTNGTVDTTTLGGAEVTYTVTEGAMQRSVQRTITVVDTTPPVPNVDPLPDIVAQCSTNVTIAPTATDACAGPITGTTSNSTSFNTQGTNFIFWTYADGNGNSTSQMQRVIIQDTTAPVPNVSVLPDIVAQCSTNVTTAPTATDNCAGLVTGTTTNTTTFVMQGTNFIYWTYSDGHGNSTIQTQRVIIRDTIAPVPNVSSLPDIIAPCSTNVTTTPTATDNCAGLITGTTTDSTSFFMAGTNYIHWTYSDGNGNSTSQVQRVILTHKVPFILTVNPLPDIVAQCSTNVTIPPAAQNACLDPAVTATTTDATSFAAQGTNFIHWTFLDQYGNSTSQVQRVIVQDTISPVPNVSVLPDIVAQCSTNVTTAPTATDNCVGTVTGTTSDPTTFSSQGTNFIRWTYSDGHGNSTIQTQRVIIADTIAPVPNVSPLPDIVAQCSTNVTTAPTARDNCVGTVTGTTSDPTMFSTQGTNFIRWTYSDGHGNSTIQTQRVIIADATAPVPNVSPLPDIAAQCSTNVTTAPTATDNCAGTVTGTTSDPTTFSTQGTNFIHWAYSNGHGNSTIQTQRVIIAETTAPSITCPTNILVNATNAAGVTVTFATPSASNPCSDTSVVCVPPSGSVFAVGTNSVTCTASDPHGHQSQCTFSVIVLGALDQTRTAFDALAALRADITNHTRFAEVDIKDLDAALSELTNSTAGASWSDNNDPRSSAAMQIFRDDLAALSRLMADERNRHSTVNKTNITSVVNELVAACRLTAVVAITDAHTNGVAAKLITEANLSVARGDAATSPSTAVRDYLAAWERVHPRRS